jgi:hypothetical protein
MARQKPLRMQKRMPICAQWKDDKGREQWCAVDGELDPDALKDLTACGMAIILRTDDAERWPTCPECRKVIGLRK